MSTMPQGSGVAHEDSLATELIRRHAGGGTRRIAESASVTIVDGVGSYLIDDHGKRYLDFVTGYGVAALGHKHPHWVKAVAGQAESLCTSPFHNPLLASYLSQLADVLPNGLGRTALFSGGAEAVETALRLVQRASRLPGVLTFDHAFHGKTTGVRFAGGAYADEGQSLGVSWLRTSGFPACKDHSATEYATCCESATQLWEQLRGRDDLDDVGAVLVEPMLGTAGNIPPMRPFLSELRRLCDERGWILVFDESQTGFGRMGAMFASEFFDVRPDVLVMGKAMGAGFPLSGVAATDGLWASAGLDRLSSTSTSYGGNPLACAAGLAVLDVLNDPAFLFNVRDVGRVLSVGLDRIARHSPYLKRPRGVGLMLGFDLEDPETGGPASDRIRTRIMRHCSERGLLIGVDVPRVRLSPPLTLSHDEADQFLEILEEALT